MRSPLIGFSITRGCLTASAGLTRKTPHPDPPPQGGREMPEPDPPPQGGGEMPEPGPAPRGGGGIDERRVAPPGGTTGGPPPPARPEASKTRAGDPGRKPRHTED